MLKLKKIHVMNFKSLRDCQIKLGKFNVLIGANSSGKTNLVDLFLLLRKIYTEKNMNPFRYWWGYQNAVWNKKEEENISVKLFFNLKTKEKSYDIIFQTTFTGIGGQFRILKEKLEIKGFFKLTFENNRLKFVYEKEYFDKIWDEIDGLMKKRNDLREFILRGGEQFSDASQFREQNIWIQSRDLFEALKPRLSSPFLFDITPQKKFVSYILNSEPELHSKNFRNVIMVFDVPIKKSPNRKKHTTRGYYLLRQVTDMIIEFFSKILVLKLNITEIKRLVPIKKEEWLLEDGSTTNTVLYNLYLKEGGIPDGIVRILSRLFPEIEVKFSLTDDQRVYAKILENDLELPPVCIADGIYKILSISSALELKSSILIVDEIENSLYPKALEKILDEFKSADTMSIVTTHSPVVVDMTDPKDLIIAEKKAGETKFRRIKDPTAARKKLQDAGITFSEGWLYGNL
ncbi:MAG: AAA family ATPase [Candidatus Helarchaeota archaeon]